MNRLRRAYEHAMRGPTTCVAEAAETPENELAWQARWFSGAFGREFTTTAGGKVVVVDFGQWNREAGPDFVQAAVRVGGREHRGDIEVDLEPSGWEQHGHATNHAYENVVLHVVVHRANRRHFSRTPSNREVPQICLAEYGSAAPEWSGFAAARPGRCLSPLRGLPVAELCELLAVAAQRRLERKASTLSSMISSRGVDAALYESVAIALGYKRNKLPFQLLAQRVPLKVASSPRGEALLLGVAGFLERPQPPPGPARSEAAGLWSSWWKQRGSFVNAILPRSAWHMSGIRPANHPLRRIAALSAIARRWKSVRAALQSADLDRLQDILGSLEHPFWSYHTTWNSPRRKTPLALIGPDRVREIHANVALPFALSDGSDPSWLELPGTPPNASLRVVSARLFGGSLPRNVPRKMFVSQGLLQIYADFCLRDHEECARCMFPHLVTHLSA